VAIGCAPLILFCLSSSTERLSQSANAAPGENDVRAIVPLWQAVTPNDPRFELVIGTNPNDGEHAEVSGAFRAHEQFSLSRCDRFDFDQLVAEPAIVALSISSA
jgi:hypothetical protein